MEAMPNVFISYNSNNLEKASTLVETLEKRGIKCWIDYRDIPGGIPFDDAIPAAIMTCDVVVIMLDQTSQFSKHIKNEVRLAVEHNKNVIPFMLEDVELIEAFDYNISANSRIFSHKNWDDAIKKLIDSVNKLFPSTEVEAIEDTETNEIIRILQMLNVQCPKCQSRNYILRHDELEKYITEGQQTKKSFKQIVY